MLSLVGDVASGEDGGPKDHALVAVSKRDWTASGGHLLKARVWPTRAVILKEAPGHPRRGTDAEVGWR